MSSSSTTTLWGYISSGGSVISGSGGFTVTNTSAGIYSIDFNDDTFSATPSIVGSQTGFGSTGESPVDNVAFPLLSHTGATAVTGDSSGNKQNRSFSFIAIGFSGS